jgi:opacity protein-like surface antigen
MKRLGLLALLAVMMAGPVWADADEAEQPAASRQHTRGFGLAGWGLRFGLGDDPDQIVGGVQWDFGQIKPVHIEPNVELGIGDDHVTLSGTFAAHYRFRYLEQFRPYAGGGVGAAINRVDKPQGGSSTSVDIGVRATGGVNWSLKSERQIFVELSLGFGYPYDAQLMAGWNF